jgi:homogentisate 1,2-dioxygenase
MPIYHKLGKFPNKRHIQYRKENGDLFVEQLFGTEGFSGLASLLYHTYRPTIVKSIGETKDLAPVIAHTKNLKAHRFLGFQAPPVDDFLESRIPLMVNNDVIVGVAAPRKSMKDYFYKNADADEMLFIHEGKGVLKTMVGQIPFEYGDYLIIPRGMIYQIEFETENNRLLYLESFSPIYTPRHYRNKFGQLGEHAPFCERDYKLPQDLETYDQKGDFEIKIKKQSLLYSYIYGSHPFDVVGWDGYCYPYAFSIHNFEPITGRVHMPPPIHQTFEANNFVVCSFVPRLYDYHPLSIPAPYNHSNIDSEEILYYVDGDFMSRNNIKKGDFTLHPAGIVHGPQPGATERSIGKKETQELAVMIDTFKPLMITKQAMALDDGSYFLSWLDK